MKRTRYLLVVLIVFASLTSGCREGGGDSDIGTDGLLVGSDGSDGTDGTTSLGVFEKDHTFRVTTLEIDPQAIGVVGTILSGLIATDLRCGILNVLAEYRGYNSADDTFILDVGAGVISADSPDPTTWYCAETSNGRIPDPDPRNYEFLSEETTAASVPARFTNLDEGLFEVTESFDLIFPAIVPGTQLDPEYLLIPLKDVQFSGRIGQNSLGALDLTDGLITGAILKSDADEIEVDLNPSDGNPGAPISSLLASVEMNYPPGADVKTGWLLDVDLGAGEVEVEISDIAILVTEPRAFRVDLLDIDDSTIGVLASILNNLITTDIRCGILNVLAYSHDYDLENLSFQIDVGGGVVADSSTDPTAWYCSEVSGASIPEPDPRTYEFIGEDTTARNVPVIITDADTLIFETSESFDLIFPAIVPGTQEDPMYLLLPLVDVSFGGTVERVSGTGQFDINTGLLTGAILKDDAEGIEVDLSPDDGKPGATLAALLENVVMNYPADSEVKTGWLLSVDVGAVEAMFDAGE